MITNKPMITLYSYIIVIVLLSMFFLTGIWRRTKLGRKLFKPAKRSPLSSELLRGPGEGLREKISDTLSDLDDDFAFMFFGPFLFLSLFFAVAMDSERTNIILFVSASVFFIWHIFKLRKGTKALESFRLGLDGELATAEGLDQLKQHGFYIFHDIPADSFNIDHVAIGPTGVFAVETKAKSKTKAKGPDSANVSVRGDTLEFPDGLNTEFINQARRQAKWLSGFLTQSVGKPIDVKPVLSLPGWYVNREDTKAMVFNHKALIGLKSGNVALDNQTIEQIKFQVEQRCRNIQPYKPT